MGQLDEFCVSGPPVDPQRRKRIEVCAWAVVELLTGRAWVCTPLPADLKFHRVVPSKVADVLTVEVLSATFPIVPDGQESPLLMVYSKPQNA